MSSSISREGPLAISPDQPLADAEPLPPGSQLGNYVIQARIGRGAMASVYRAEHSLLNKPVALKVMASALLANAEARQRFLREARAVAAIQHPNVVAISDAGLVDGTPYLVMELLTGEDLEQRLDRQGPLGARELAAVALPLVAALAAAHDAGVIHRDLKPGNIFLARGAGGELVPKLLDFGISKFSGPSTSSSLAMTAFDQLLGSPLYLPPEALQGSRELTARSDQYSLGVVLYECITGQAPFFREDLVPLLNAISEGACAAPRSLRPELAAELESAILRAMSVDPAQRFEHVRDLGRALLGVADARTRQLWGPALGAPDLGAPEPAPSAALVLAASPERVFRAPASPPRRAARRPRLWATLALLATGTALLVLALGRQRASSALLPIASSQGLGVAAAAPFEPQLRENEPPSRPLLSAQPPVVAPVAVVLAGSPAREDSAVARSMAAAGQVSVRGRRALPRGGESDSDVRRLFFPELAARKEGLERPRREGAAPRAPVPARSSSNEAPLFD